MADKILHKRNLSAGNVPTTSSLDVGELAINVADGKLFLRQSGSIANKIITVGESASFASTASFVTSSNIYGPYGANSIISASYALQALSSSYANFATSASHTLFAETASNALNAQDILIYVLNNSGYNIPKGTVVHITASGNSSDTPRIISASYENDANSANTLGIANESIANGANGYVMTEGVLKGIDTSAFISGQMIYLGTSGSIIGTAPQAPLHAVRLGQVVRVQSNNGSVYVRIDNGYELDELHDVRIMTASLQYGDLLMRSGSVWTNSKQLSGSYGIAGTLSATSITASGLYAGATYISGSLIVNGQSTFYGTASFVSVTASNLFVSESFISVNVFEPVERFGGIKVYDSGSSTATASLAWDSLHNHWVYQNVDGLTYTGGMLLSGPRNTGSLGDEPNLTKWFVPRSDGGDHLNDSQIFTSGSITQVTGSLTVTNGLNVRGSGATSATTALRVENTNASASLIVNDAGDVFNNGARGVTSNTFYGENVGRNNTGGFNTFIGNLAGRNSTVANDSTFVGANTGQSVTTGIRNTIIGSQAGSSLTSGTSNTFLGRGAGASLNGSDNTFIGAQSFAFGTSGSSNTTLGSDAGLRVSAGTNMTTVNNSVFLGFDTRANANSETNQIVIGHQAIGLGSNTSVIGNTSTTLFRPYGNVAINRNSATASLDVAGTTRISGSFNTATSGSILTVIGSGSAQPVFTVQGSQGELFSVTDSLSGSLFSVNDISGLPILEVFSDNTTLIGNYLDPMLITTAKVTQTNSGSFTVYSLPTASYDTAFFEYSVKSGSNARAGTIMAIQSGSSVNFTETTTTDFGSTSAISLGVFVTGSNMALTGSSTTGSWTIKAIVRGL